jgi:CTP synthase
MKCDPYLNLNAGTMNPRQHGEVFLCDDGSETDLDLGHYERLAGITVSRMNIFTSGTLYKEILQEEEQGNTWAIQSRSCRTSPTKFSSGCVRLVKVTIS